MVPMMCTPPLNSLPAIRVDARKAMCSLTPDMAWGSPTSHAGLVVPLETDDQLRRSAPVVATSRMLVCPWWRRGEPAAPLTRMLTVPTLATWRQHHDGAESGHRSRRVERRWY